MQYVVRPIPLPHLRREERNRGVGVVVTHGGPYNVVADRTFGGRKKKTHEKKGMNSGNRIIATVGIYAAVNRPANVSVHLIGSAAMSNPFDFGR